MTALFFLATSVLLALRDDEGGADLLADLRYRVWKDEGVQPRCLAHEQLLALPQEWLA